MKRRLSCETSAVLNLIIDKLKYLQGEQFYDKLIGLAWLNFKKKILQNVDLIVQRYFTLPIRTLPLF